MNCINLIVLDLIRYSREFYILSDKYSYMQSSEEIERANPLIDFLGMIGPLLFGVFGMNALLGKLTAYPYLDIYFELAILGLGLFVLGALLIPFDSSSSI